MSGEINTGNKLNLDRFIEFIGDRNPCTIEPKDWKNIIWAIQEQNESLSDYFTSGNKGKMNSAATNPETNT